MTGDPEDLIRIRRALLSVSDTTGLAEIARFLVEFGVELIATDGTARHLASAGIPSRRAEELTGVGSWFDGRIKTLHPGLLGGILYPRTPEGEAERSHRGIVPIDLVIVNLYPFGTLRPGRGAAPEPEDRIDVGGVTLLRAAAKNHRWVAVVIDPSQYPGIVEELRRNGGALSSATRRALARRAFDHSQEYDRRVVEVLSGPSGELAEFPRRIPFERMETALRYGENPHQRAAMYAAGPGVPIVPGSLDLLQGDPLSYNNLLDLDTAVAVVGEFATPTAAVVKHASPCGVSSGTSIEEALEKALATDPVGRYGCVIATNRRFDAAAVSTLRGVYVDALAAPAVEPAARHAMQGRKKLKLVAADPLSPETPRWEARTALGRLLVQESDQRQMKPEEFRPVTRHRATPSELGSLDFAWRVVRYVRSNGVVLAQGASTVGVGAGQPSRVKAVELAVEVAGPRARGSVLASDAFFPFADGIEVAARAGIRAILHPGGSIRDDEVVAAAERSGIAMYVSGWRVFRH